MSTVRNRFSYWKILLAVLIILAAGVGLIIFTKGPDQQPAPAGKPVQEAFNNSKVFDFDEDQVDKLPASFQSGRTGQGTKSEWSVKFDETAPSPPNVLAQTAAESVSFHFPYVILAGKSFEDFSVSVSFKAISGGIDEAAGIIFRFVDSDNYYVLRANALENNLVLFKYVKGSRSLVTSTPVPVSSGQWHSLRVVAISESVHGYLDSMLLINVKDSTYKEGFVGLWTKADSVTYFDDFTVKY